MGCSSKTEVRYIKCVTPTIDKPKYIVDFNGSHADKLKVLMDNKAIALEYADKLEKANKVCK